MGTVTELAPVRDVVREVGNLCGLYRYGRRAQQQFKRNAIRAALRGQTPTCVIARQCVPPKWRRLGDGVPPKGAA